MTYSGDGFVLLRSPVQIGAAKINVFDDAFFVVSSQILYSGKSRITQIAFGMDI
jgi:hypothetical protein